MALDRAQMEDVWLDDLHLAALPRPGKTSAWVNAFRDIGRPVAVPLMVARGAFDGPTVMAVAGVHGNEYEGMSAIRRVFRELDTARMSGTFAAIPVANPFAYDARSRVAPNDIDGLNLARVFPGSEQGTPSQKLASVLLRFIDRHVGESDLFIDFHSGSHDTAFATVVGVRDVDTRARELSHRAARHFGIPDLWLIPDSSGPLNASTARMGIPTIATETVGRAGCDPAGTAAFTTGIFRILALYGILGNVPKPSPYVGRFLTTTNVHATCSGILENGAHIYQQVGKGQSLGTLVDVFGMGLDEIVAPCSGTIWAARANPAVRTGELMFMIADSVRQ